MFNWLFEYSEGAPIIIFWLKLASKLLKCLNPGYGCYFSSETDWPWSYGGDLPEMLLSRCPISTSGFDSLRDISLPYFISSCDWFDCSAWSSYRRALLLFSVISRFSGSSMLDWPSRYWWTMPHSEVDTGMLSWPWLIDSRFSINCTSNLYVLICFFNATFVCVFCVAGVRSRPNWLSSSVLKSLLTALRRWLPILNLQLSRLRWSIDYRPADVRWPADDVLITFFFGSMAERLRPPDVAGVASSRYCAECSLCIAKTYELTVPEFIIFVAKLFEFWIKNRKWGD